MNRPTIREGISTGLELMKEPFTEDSRKIEALSTRLIAMPVFFAFGLFVMAATPIYIALGGGRSDDQST